MKKEALLGLIIAWLSYIPLGFWIVETHTFGAIYDGLNLSQSILRYYITENAFDLAFMGILTIGLFILVIHRFRYTKKTHFRITNITKIVVLSTVLIAILGMVIQVFIVGTTHPFHAYLGEYIKQLLWVGMVEELIFRGYIFIELLKLKTDKFKLIYVVLLSALMFSIIHLPAYFLYNSQYDFFSIFWRLLFPFMIGILYAYLLYMNKDIISLIFIHATSNMISNYTGTIGLVWVILFWIGLIGYTYYAYVVYKRNTMQMKVE
ncbi:CPBP family intramembrane metalloprotease [Acholeplasma manati]|uniref:CPBP family intramembrane metalloprotease n=1 Tax=Paracholeplasma manati TaxID=591373 RepID=A0ABT2Y393_9MOLU|nr:CPBP family intramembrane glutamic endopeptidase [Paracholeplasma manati]MCV2231207.1 CPBP family intramembrane metalloprotease [Paracholeplasma manati]